MKKSQQWLAFGVIAFLLLTIFLVIRSNLKEKSDTINPIGIESVVRDIAADWYKNHNNSYVGFCKNSTVLKASNSLSNKVTYFGCDATVSTFAILAVFDPKKAPSNYPPSWCVDSSGFWGEASSTSLLPGALCK